MSDVVKHVGDNYKLLAALWCLKPVFCCNGA
jgi:hypothetical protein